MSFNIVSTPIGNLEDISNRAIRTLKNSEIILCEKKTRAIKLLNHLKIKPELLIPYHDEKFTKISKLVIKELNNFYFFRIVPLIGNLLMPGQDMFQYLPNSSLEYPNQELLKRLMFEAGFQQVEIHDFVFGASPVHVACKPTIN